MISPSESAFRENLLNAIGAQRIRIIRVHNWYLSMSFGVLGISAGLTVGFWLWGI